MTNIKFILCILFFCVFTPIFAQNVTIYSYRQPYLLKPLLQAFEENSGIKTKVLFLKTGLNERLESEGKLSPADLILTTDIQRLNQLVAKNLVQPVSSKTLTKLVPTELRHRQNLWFALSLRARVIYAAKNNIPRGTIQNYQDLTNKKWRGKICTRSAKHSYNLGLIASMIAQNGILDTKKWLIGVKKNLARKPQGNDRAQVKAIYAGQCDLSLGNSYYLGVMATNKKNPEQKKWAQSIYAITPNQQKEGTNVNISGMALSKYTSNKKQAIMLMEFLVSKKAQKIYANVNHEFPIRGDVALSKFSQKEFGKFKKNLAGIAKIPNHYRQASDLVDEVMFDF